MQVQAINRNVRMSAQKMREVVRQIQGLPAIEALAVLAVIPRKSAREVAKTLKSAMANAASIQSDWGSKAQQQVGDLERQLANTQNRKKKNAIAHKLAQYQSFTSSKNALAPESLVVKEAVAGTATSIRRFTPKARGSAGPIIKRSCHIKITLSDE
jgi:large subunit ribosomal protein L22